MDDLNLGNTEDFATITSRLEHFSQPLDSFEVEKNKKVVKCNMRKSLAWDAAFFTSAGVLDADELSCMIDGGNNICTSQVLPGIEEDIYRSTDSLSTLGSENLTLENLEVDLFEDIRASIQKSSLKSNIENLLKVTSPLNKGLASKTLAKSSTGPKKQTSRVQTSGNLHVQSSNSPKGKHSVAGSRIPTPSLQKATRPNDRPIPGPSAALGRSSLRENQVRLERNKEKGTSSIAKLVPLPKVSSLTGPKRTLPKPVILSNLSASSTSTATNRKDPPNSNSSSDSINSRRISTRSFNPTSTNSILKPPLNLAMKKKVDNNGLSSSRSSKVSTSISPASSISEWSVASSSSTSSVNQCSNTPSLSNVRRSNDRGLEKHENKMHRPISEKTNVQRGPLLKPASAKPSGVKMPSLNTDRLNAGLAQKGQANKSELAKPSGLRMPSPKIGFFDGVKAVSNSPSGSSQFRAGVPLSPKVGKDVFTPTGISSKANSPKLQPTRLANPVRNIKRDTQKSASPRPSKKVSNASTKVCDSPKNVETTLNLSPLSKNELEEKEYLNTKETVVKELSVVNGEETEMISVVDANREISADLENLKIVPMVGDIYDCKGKTASEEKYNDVKISGKTSHPADLKNGVDLDEQMSANLVNSKIVSESEDEGVLYCDGIMEFKEKNKDVRIITETNRSADSNNEINLDENMKANLLNSKIVRENGDIFDCMGRIASEEKSNDVTSITEDFGSSDLKIDTTLEQKPSTNSVIMTLDPLKEGIYDCDEKMAFEGNNKDVISITEKISPDDLKIGPADVENFDCGSNDVISSTEKINFGDLKSKLNLGVNMTANLGNMEMVLLDAGFHICGRKPVCVESNDDKISQDVESEIKLEVKLAEYLYNEYIHFHRVEMNPEEKITANLANMKVAPMDEDIFEKEVVCQRNTGDEKSEIKRLNNNWNSPYKSAEKENQERDLQKENDISSFSNPKNCGQTEELLSNLSKIGLIFETRTPFTDKNSSNNAEGVDFSAGIIADEMEKMTLLPSLEYSSAEN